MTKQQLNFDSIGDASLNLSADFVNNFPKLSALIKNASVIDFTINSNKRYRQFIWQLADNETCGWLCQLEHVVPQDLNLIPEHILLNKTIGGIIEHWGDEDFDETFLYAKNFTFGLQDAINSFEWEESYLESCEEEDSTPIDVSKLLTFSQEANGDNTFYNKETKEVFLFAHDGYSPLDITLVDGQPDCTIYTYDNVKTFNDYVETLADQWQQIIDTRKK